MAKKPVIVGPSGTGRWNLQVNGKTVSSHKKQSTATNKGEAIAKDNKAELIIRGRDGRIRSKDSYGTDRCPPKDKEH